MSPSQAGWSRTRAAGAAVTSAEMESVAASDVALSRQDADRVREISRRHGVARVRVFGSAARGEAGPGSDLDLLVAFEPGRGFRHGSLRGGRGGPRSEGRRGGRRRAEPVHQGPRAEGGRGSVKDDRLYLGHLLEAIERILLYGQDGEERFRTDVRTQDAIIRNLQVLGRSSEEGFGRDPLTRIPRSLGRTSPACATVSCTTARGALTRLRDWHRSRRGDCAGYWSDSSRVSGPIGKSTIASPARATRP